MNRPREFVTKRTKYIHIAAPPFTEHWIKTHWCGGNLTKPGSLILEKWPGIYLLYRLPRWRAIDRSKYQGTSSALFGRICLMNLYLYAWCLNPGIYCDFIIFRYFRMNSSCLKKENNLSKPSCPHSSVLGVFLCAIFNNCRIFPMYSSVLNSNA